MFKKKVFFLILIVFSKNIVALSGELLFINNCETIIGGTRETLTFLNGIASRLDPLSLPLEDADIPLFDYYPDLKTTVPYVSLGNFPTLIQQILDCGTQFISTCSLFIKRDDLGGRKHEECGHDVCPHLSFGGGKVRKLEFLLGDAVCNRAETILSVAPVGSNHAVATTVYAHLLGLKSIVVLENEDTSDIVQRNLLLCKHYDADFHLYYDTDSCESAMLFTILKNKFLYDDIPYVIPEYGHMLFGVAGFINAALELKQQVDDGDLPEPDFVYLPMGTMRSVAGLMLGFEIAGMKTKVRTINIQGNTTFTKTNLLALVHDVRDFLSDKDLSFSVRDFLEADVDVVDYDPDIFVQDMPTLVSELTSLGLSFDKDYALKAFVSFLDDVENNLSDKVVLFWNTYYDNDFPFVSSTVNYKLLPRTFHHFFE